MNLQEIVKADVLSNFITIENFNNQIDYASNFCSDPCKAINLSIKQYYNILFQYEIDLENDMICFNEMAQHYLDCLKNQYHERNLFVLNFLINRISQNMIYVQSIRKLA